MFNQTVSILVEKIGERTLPRRLISLLFSARMLSLADQAVVSGTSFLATVLIGRFTFPNQLGVYVLASSLLIAAINIQHSLIALPYTLGRGRGLDDDHERAGRSLMLAIGLALVVAIAVAVVTGWISALGTIKRLAGITATLACFLPFILLREFCRDITIARLRFLQVLALDVCVAAIQLTALGLLAWSGHMSGAAALAVAGGACGVAVSIGLYLTRRTFVLRSAGLAAAAKENWLAGKWLLANLFTLVLQVQVVYWLLATVSGTTETGKYAACMSVVGLVSPLISGLSNPMFAKAVAALAEGGKPSLRRQASQDVLLLGLGTAAFCIIIATIGDDVVHLLFPSKAYAGNYHVVVLLSVWQMAFAVGIPASNGLAVMDATYLNFWHGLVGMVISTVLVLLLVGPLGPTGAALGLLLGTTIRTITRWYAFWRLTSQKASASLGEPKSNAIPFSLFAFAQPSQSAMTRDRGRRPIHGKGGIGS